MLTAIENVSLPLVFRGVEKRARKMAVEMMNAVGLYGYERGSRAVGGGQQQRVGIARALVGNPKIIFADEPTGNLDSSTSEGSASTHDGNRSKAPTDLDFSNT